MIVSKFGGSSVADDNQIRKVKAILESDERRRIAVVSAPGKRNKEDQKITDLLYKCNSMVQKGQTCRPVFNEISKRFVQIAQKLHIDDVKISEKLDDHFVVRALGAKPEKFRDVHPVFEYAVKL